MTTTPVLATIGTLDASVLVTGASREFLKKYHTDGRIAVVAVDAWGTGVPEGAVLMGCE